MSKPVSAIVAALLPSFGIGNKGQLPWRLSKELKYFRKVTTGTEPNSHAVIMGRKTWESIPAKFRPLSGRVNVVISRNRNLELGSDKVLLYTSIQEAIDQLDKIDTIKNIFIIGGAQIYNDTLSVIDNLLITEIEAKDGIEMDTFLDKEYIKHNFVRDEGLNDLVGFDASGKHEENGFSYEFTLYRRK